MTIIPISGIIGVDIMPDSIRQQLDEAGGDDVEVQIASPGGFISAGLEIYNLIRNYEGKKTTHLMGIAASMASYIVMAGDWVKSESNAILMIHNPWGITIGDYRDMREQAEVLDGMANVLSKAYAKKSGKSAKEVRKLMDSASWYFGEEALTAGFVDEMIETETDENQEDGDDKESAIASARAQLRIVSDRMRASGYQEDREKIAAYLGQGENDIFGSAVSVQKEQVGVSTGNSDESLRVRLLREYAAGCPGNKLVSREIENAIREGKSLSDPVFSTGLAVAARDGNPIDLEAAKLAGMTLDEFRKWNLVSANKQY